MRSLFFIFLLAFLAGIILIGCVSSPPKNTGNACEIFEDKDGWYKATRKSYDKWKVPIHVQLAIMHQESRFQEDAKPPRTKLLWVIPWSRKSSAYGYGQVKDGTWEWYQRDTGNSWADRDDFEDVADFIGWYGNVSHRKLGIAKSDAYSQYLAYHEGHGGYKRKTYRKKKWLIKVAKKVSRNAERYRAQLARCEKDLNRGWSVWPF